MRFKRVKNPRHLDGCEGYSAFDFDMSFVISFDHKNPGMGWRASYRKEGGKVVHLQEVFTSKKAAIDALQIERKRVAQ